SPRLCSIAGLLHDLRHPPFGHNGEKALDDCMKSFGGFEGNAQTLRIVAKIEKKARGDEVNSLNPDKRLGLNLAYRTLGAILKYDRVIPSVRTKEESLVKGYYADEQDLVVRIKDHVDPKTKRRPSGFKTIECAIMDIADDIAYSTYDLEDTLKAGFFTP